MAYEVIWQYRVRMEFDGEFRAAYGSSGAWAKLFSKHAGYVGTRLLFDVAQNLYVTLDSWKSRQDFDEFYASHRKEYDETDVRFAHFVDSTSRVGTFESSE